MTQDIFAPKSSFNIGFEQPQEGVVDNTEKIKSDFQAMSLGAQAKAVQGQASLESSYTQALNAGIQIVGQAYDMYDTAREKSVVSRLLSDIDNVDAKADQNVMSFEERRSAYSSAVNKAASSLPGGYSDLAKYNTALKAKTGMDFGDMQKTTAQTQYEAMQKDPQFITAYAASKVIHPDYTEDQRLAYAQNHAAETAAVTLMATTVKNNSLAEYYTKVQPKIGNQVKNLDIALMAAIQMKQDSGAPITTMDIEELEVRVSEAQRLIDLSIPNFVPEEERAQYDEYFTNLASFLSEVKDSKEPDKIVKGISSYLAQTGGTIGDIVAGANLLNANLLTSQAGVELHKALGGKLSDGTLTAAMLSKGSLGNIFDALVEARKGDVIGPNTIMTKEELDVYFSTKGLTPEDMMKERELGLNMIKSLEVSDIATEKGRRQLVAGIASTVKSLNNLDLQQTGSKLNEIIVDSGLIEKLNLLDSYDTATANQIRTLVNSAVTNNLRFSEAKVTSMEATGPSGAKGAGNRNPDLVWDEATQTYYATNEEYIDSLKGKAYRRGYEVHTSSSLRTKIENLMTEKGLPIVRGGEFETGDITRAYKHRDVIKVANSILSKTIIQEVDEVSVNVGGAPQQIQSDVLNFIKSGEGDYTSSNRGTIGDDIIGTQLNGTTRGGKLLTEMTIGEIKRYQKIKDPNNVNRLFAVGAYQLTPNTIDKAMKDAGFNDNTVFSEDVQDRMGLALILGSKRPRLAAYIKGESDNIDAAMLEFSQEFASVPNPVTGKSHYANKGNKAKHTVAETKQILQKARESYASGIISEKVLRKGEMSVSDVSTMAESAIEKGKEEEVKPETEPKVLNITQAPWWDETAENNFKKARKSTNSKPEDVLYFATEAESDAAEASGIIKKGDIIVVDQTMVVVD
tara:strand:+ start:19747 stop:22476 length:2730 start_codon:yes stop_codon:yes gene_type:complete